MADDYNRNEGKNDNAAKTLAVIAIVLAIIALGWAVKADKHAGNAMNKASQASSGNNTTPSLNASGSNRGPAPTTTSNGGTGSNSTNGTTGTPATGTPTGQ